MVGLVRAWGAQFEWASTGENTTIVLDDNITEIQVMTDPVSGFFGFLLEEDASITSMTFKSSSSDSTKHCGEVILIRKDIIGQSLYTQLPSMSPSSAPSLSPSVSPSMSSTQDCNLVNGTAYFIYEDDEDFANPRYMYMKGRNGDPRFRVLTNNDSIPASNLESDSAYHFTAIVSSEFESAVDYYQVVEFINVRRGKKLRDQRSSGWVKGTGGDRRTRMHVIHSKLTGNCGAEIIDEIGAGLITTNDIVGGRVPNGGVRDSGLRVGLISPPARSSPGEYFPLWYFRQVASQPNMRDLSWTGEVSSDEK